jgi:NAD+ synthase
VQALGQMQAATNVKQRLRMIRLYEHAERRGFLVAGTTNRTEMAQGFFVRYGDGGVDVEPLAHLYKAQVYALARRLEIPAGIIERPPSPDTFSAAVDDAEFYFRLPYDLLDRFLAGLGQGDSAASVATPPRASPRSRGSRPRTASASTRSSPAARRRRAG